MAVVSVTELPERGGKNSRGIRTYTRTFKITVNSQSDDPYVAGSSPLLPKIGSSHPSDPFAWCVDIDVKAAGGWTVYLATATYDSTNELNENPLAEPVVIEWDGENYDEALVYDTNGDAVLNSAGDPFENAMRERTRRVVTAVRNISAVPSWIITSEDAVNSSAFILDGFTIPTGKAKLGAPRLGKWQVRNGVRYREMTMRFTLNKDGWNYQPLQRGYRYRNGSSELVRITSDDGTDVTQPVCLNGSGGLLANPTPATAVYGDFDIYPAYNFNLLPLT